MLGLQSCVATLALNTHFTISVGYFSRNGQKEHAFLIFCQSALQKAIYNTFTVDLKSEASILLTLQVSIRKLGFSLFLEHLQGSSGTACLSLLHSVTGLLCYCLVHLEQGFSNLLLSNTLYVIFFILPRLVLNSSSS